MAGHANYVDDELQSSEDVRYRFLFSSPEGVTGRAYFT